MKNLKIFPKMLLQILAILLGLVTAVHILIFYIFPKIYLEARKEKIYSVADDISKSLNGKDINYIENALEFYSQNNDIKVFIKESGSSGEVKIHDNIIKNINGNNNSLIIEERNIKLHSGEKKQIQFISNADMKKEAKYLSLKVLPYSLTLSIILSILISIIYAKIITYNIKEIKSVTKNMMNLDREAILKVDSTNEVGELKNQINELYNTLLNLIDNLELKNKEIKRLEKIKREFFRSASHELKTPLASLKIILENMKYNVGKYKNHEKYFDDCIDIIDDLSRNISQILVATSLEQINNNKEVLIINNILKNILEKYSIIAKNRNITINNNLKDEKINMDKRHLEIVLSNLISNAVKYSNEGGIININADKSRLYIENSWDMDDTFDIESQLNSTLNIDNRDSSGLGLSIVKNILINNEVDFKIKRTQIGICFMIEIIK